ncbi:MAG: Ca-activated chloride channel family protein [Paraglaciecola sp.]|jgi:Ca-activated chloride channel family protein
MDSLLDALSLNTLSLHTLSQFHFLRPWWALTLIPFVVVLLLQFKKNQISQRWHGIIAPHILKHLIVKQGVHKLFNPITLIALLMVVSVVVLMGPSWSRQPSPFVEDAAALVVVLDVSSSMQSKDVQPSRLERAKQKVTDLLNSRKGNKASLIVYAGSAHTVLPLTNDSDILQIYLQAIDSAIMPKQGKFPEKVIPILDQHLKDPLIPSTVLLITDGLGQASLSAFSEYFKTKPYQLLVLGVGKTTEQIKLEGLKGIPPIEEEKLQQLASANNGKYISLTIDESDINQIDNLIDGFFVLVDNEEVPWVDQGYYLLFVALLILLPWFRKGWSIQWVLAALMIGGMTTSPKSYAGNGFTDLWLTPDQQGRWYFAQQDYITAGERFDKAMWKGVSYYMAEEFALAAEYFSRVDNIEALFNLANTMSHSQNYVVAKRIYQQVVKQNPGHKKALKNLKLVSRIIEEINRLSESQLQEEGGKPQEMGKDTPLRAEGADEKIYTEQELVQFSAEDILQDKSLNEMWMKSVQKDPAQFLSNKFAQQLGEGDAQ